MSEQLSELLQHQLDLQRDAFKRDPTAMSDEERIAFIHWNVTALQAELFEMLQEIGWKPWALSRHINEDRAVGEMIDAWHFFANILLALTQSDPVDIADEFCRRYAEKRAVNTKRQEDGYDGVSTKCPGCKRELSECGSRIVSMTADGKHGTNECGGCGHRWRVTLP